MLAQCRKGKKLDHGFKRDVWNQILIDFNTRRDSEHDFNIRQIKNRATLVSFSNNELIKKSITN